MFTRSATAHGKPFVSGAGVIHVGVGERTNPKKNNRYEVLVLCGKVLTTATQTDTGRYACKTCSAIHAK